MVELSIQFTTKIFLLNFCFMPPQMRSHGNGTKIVKMARTLQPRMLDAKFSSVNAEYPSSYLLSIYYSFTAQFFK